ncbi:MAG: hypothetical protein KBD15_02790, partial [Candidatus Magasanikbacteria bacterium]|nr:hypothetical protein [Candidatus Magasanikbacteria bacterium]
MASPERSKQKEAASIDPHAVQAQYRKDTVILLNRQGVQEQFKLENTGQILAGKFVVEVTPVGGGPRERLELPVVPEIVPFQTGAVIGEYTVDALTPTKDGTVEYTVTTRSGERLLRIPKELLEGVQAVDAIEKQLNEVGKDIRHVVGEKAKDLQERQAKMKSLFLQVQSELGGTFKKGQAFTKKEVEVFTKKFDTIVEKSLTALEELQKELKEHLDTEKRKVVVAGQVFTDGQKVFYTQRGGTPEEYKVKIDATQLGRPAPKNIILEGKDARGNVVTFAVSEQAVRDRLLFAAEPSMSKLNQKDFGFKHFAKTEKEKAAEAEILAAERKKDVEDAKSEYETRKAIVLRIKKLFDEDIPRFVDKKLKDSLALLREEELDFYEQQLALYKQDLADWDARNNHKWLTQKSRPTDPPPKDRKVYQDPSDPLPLFPQRPQRDKIVYTPKEIEQQKESAIGDYIFSIMSGNGILDIDQPQVSDFIYEVNLRRFDRAEKELLAGKTEVDATTGILDYKESLYKWEVTRDIIKEVIHDWSKDFTPPKEKPAPTQTFPEGELVFDLDVEIGEATKHTGELLVAVHGRDAVNEHILLGIETDISTLWGVLLSAKDAVDFKKNKTVQAYLDLSPKKQIDIETKLQSGDIKVQQQGVNELRVAVLKGVYAKLRTIESAIASLQEGDVRRAVVKATEEAEKNAKKILKETQDDIAKRDVEKRAKATESEKITRKIDLPPHIIKELLGRNATRVEAIMQQLYVGIFEAGPSGSKQIKQQTQDAFRNLFDGVSLPAALQNELATYGITNWDMFLGTWKDHLALPVAEVMSQAAESKIKQMVAEKMSTFGATLKKMKKMSGQIVGRALLTAGLVGGASLGVASIPGIFAAFGAWGVIGSSAAAGATAGGVRGMLNKWLFGGEKAQAKAAQKMQEVEDEMHDDILNNLKLNNPETFNLFAHVLSQTTREVTNTIAGKEKTGIAEVDALDVNARSLYEEALAGMEETNIDTEQQRQLAIAISRMSQKGNVLTKETVASMDKRVLGALDGLVGKYTGQKGIMPAIVTGAAIGTLLAGIRSTAESVQEAGDVSRATMGALFGAVAGLRYAEKRRYDSERKDAQAVLERRKNNIELRIYQIKRNPTSVAPFLAAARADVAAIEKMLRGKGVKEDVVALTYLVKKEKPKRGKFDTEQIEDADFAIFTDEELVKHLQSLVHEARRAGIMQERKEDAYDLQKAMDTLQKQGNALEEKATKGLGARLLSWGKKQGDRFVWMAGGAVVGGVSALAIGNMFRLGAEKAGIIHAPTAEMDKAIAASAAGFEKTSGGVSAALGGAGALESHSDASWLERLGKSFDDLVDKAKSAGSKLADMSDAMSPEVTAASIAERLGILNETLGGADAKGKNVLHLANVLEKDAAQRTFIIAQERAAHADYKGLTDNQVIHKWRVGLAKDAGWDFTTKTFDKTPLYQVTDSSGKTHTIEYKPYMKPDGTVGIKADDMFVLE